VIYPIEFVLSEVPLPFNTDNEVYLCVAANPVFRIRLLAGKVAHRPYPGRDKGQTGSSVEITSKIKSKSLLSSPTQPDENRFDLKKNL
jgi:hypothetical protein